MTELEKCTIFGDPYYHTFDGFTYHFLGRMNYYLIKTVDKLPKEVEPLTVEGRNKLSPKGSSTLHEVTSIVYGYKIQLQEDLVVLVSKRRTKFLKEPEETTIDHLGLAEPEYPTSGRVRSQSWRYFLENGGTGQWD